VLNEVSSDSEEEFEVSVTPSIIVEEYPSLSTISKPKVAVHLPSIKSETKLGWAAIAAKPKAVEEIVLPEVEERTITLPHKIETKKYERDMSKKVYTKNWADWSDTDSDEDDEEQAPPMPYKRPVNITDVNYDSDW
jgi:hypothetical protein